MDRVSSTYVERLQLLYQKSPQSRVFAPLSEAYLSLGLKEEALQMAKEGVSQHPHFAGGRVALAKILLDLDLIEEAVPHLQAAVEQEPENILALSLLADHQLKLKRPKQALQNYKMLLFLNPQNKKAQRAVQRLESLTADEFDDDVFSMKQLNSSWMNQGFPLETDSTQRGESISPLKSLKNLERVLSLIDAFIVRNDLGPAMETLNEARRQLGEHPQIMKRINLLNERKRADTPLSNQEDPPSMNLVEKEILDSKIDLLRKIQKQISRRQLQRSP